LPIGLAGNYEFSEFDFSGMHNFYNPRPWSELHIFGAGIPIMYMLSDRWTLALIPVAQMAAEPGANWSRAVSYGGVVGAVYHFGKDRMIGLGVGGIDNLAQVSVFPYFVINWKFNEHLRLNTPYRAGPGGPGGIELTYIVNKDLEFALGVSYQSKRFRLSQTISTPTASASTITSLSLPACLTAYTRRWRLTYMAAPRYLMKYR
jgi:hypothetical protein